MARTPVIAGNWKCHMRLDTAWELASGLRDRVNDMKNVDKVVCPAFVHLATVEAALTTSDIYVGAQDVHWEDDVAATGEIGPQMLEELAEYAIIGHSERRHRFGETDEAVNRKVRAALEHGLKPMMCVGETQDERDEGKTEHVLIRQVRHGLMDVEIADGFIIAYEPVWAIGTGTPATADDAEQAIDLVRREVSDIYTPEKAETVRILYGGSVKAENIGEFMARETIDGALVGGASLKVESFAGIIEETARVR